MNKLDGKVAIITGGAGGIGRATAEAFLNEGANVLIFDLNEDNLIKVSKEIGSTHLSYFVGDVTKYEDNIRAVEIVKEKYGGLDIFIANAGIEGEVKNIEDYNIDKFDQVIAVNIKGPFLGLKASIPAMNLRKGGSFIITSSITGLKGSPGIAPYGTSKHAVIGLMRSAAKECAEKNIRVNTVNPSPVETRMMRSLEEGLMPGEAGEAKNMLEANIPLGRYAMPIDVAKLMLFLASEDSSFITGSVYTVDGGSSA
ncbi:SDR family oxidoreductase [Hyphomicrobiales bacterium]|jgi:NAD(P)-dependent dehydrogenase (short-subunit alcohol dehydrogenase family)|nr:SDR family oxidoreductase [Hyphomicrobiales bacterium]|tara:strand:- start:1028 stop:1792 length:765 start_codon:yes stop_codon:yes gene_type:complete